MTGPAAARRRFTVAEANQQLPALRELFGRVMQLRGQLKLLYQRLDAAGHAPSDEEIEGDEEVELDEDEELAAEAEEEDDPDAPSPDVLRDRAWFRGLLETLREQVEEIQATGCLIKDIEVGLVDWPALHQGREVYLCWRYGEAEVAWWHEVSAGFAGRRPVAELDAGD
ncbi:MAG TPA: DUF2203 domain-containing protein [Kofleriaceae bacterium]|nr:DUF2203 domain-containing protein [Kofleriaceae bacterium]